MIQVLVADDSPLFADAIVEVLNSDPELHVVGVARDGAEAVRQTTRLRPDVVIMDVRMPVMDGLAAIEQIMHVCPTPVLVMTSDPRGDSGELSFEALRRGALDLVVKPSEWPVSPTEREEIVQHIKLLASISVVKRHAPRRPASVRRQTGPRGLAPRAAPEAVGVVSSTGGPAALAALLGALKADYPTPLLIVQHLAADFAPRLARWLDAVSPLSVRLAEENDSLTPGTALLAPDGTHTVIERLTGRVRLDASAPLHGHRPSGTMLLRSLARAFGPASAGVVLTGMGSDGADGLLSVRRAGGVTFAQDEASSVVYGMPKAARDIGAATYSLAPVEIAAALERISGPERRA